MALPASRVRQPAQANAPFVGAGPSSVVTCSVPQGLAGLANTISAGGGSANHRMLSKVVGVDFFFFFWLTSTKLQIARRHHQLPGRLGTEVLGRFADM